MRGTEMIKKMAAKMIKELRRAGRYGKIKFDRFYEI